MSSSTDPVAISVKPALFKMTTEESTADEATRDQMVAYWKHHTGNNPSESTMMLMTEKGASSISSAEQKEIFEKLGKIEDKSIIELGAGMGRYTSLFATKKLASLHAVDFMEASIKKNEKLHAHVKGFTFEQADVTKLVIPEDKQFDVVFSNWLMMYLSDKEVKRLASNMAKWCKPGGTLFFRESCTGGASGNIPRNGFNPTNYRDASQYTAIFDALPGFKRVDHGQVKCYVEIKNKTNQYSWKYVHVGEEAATQE